MRYVYVDNFRGFSRALIPIADVNFLVGENSTGKSSILGLLDLIGSADTWLKNEFDIRKIGMGAFHDVVSVASKDRSYFIVGMLFSIPDKKLEEEGSSAEREARSSDDFVAFAFMFKEHEGMPRIDSFISYRDGVELKIRYKGNSVNYKSREIKLADSAESFSPDFCEWSSTLKSDKVGFSVLRDAPPFLRRLPPIVALHFIRELLKKKESYIAEMRMDLSSFLGDVSGLAPIRSKPRKTYDEFNLEYSPEGNHTPYIIKKTLESKNDSSGFRSFLNKVGADSGLFKHLEIKNYGRTSSSPFELDIVLSNHPLSIKNVGYGISQSLPVIVELFSSRKGNWLAIQQPEVHIHPRAQAALGSAIYELSASEEKRFLIETHSDYMIDRFRVELRNGSHKTNAQVLFFERTETGNKVTPIVIDSHGGFDPDQPNSYREFFIREELSILGL